MSVIGIIDYGMGNLRSVKNALDYLGVKSFISASPKELEKSDKLILPGVGAFPEAWERMNRDGLSEFIKNEIRTKKILGICLGMQLLFEKSYEFKECDGMSLIPGYVVKLSAYSEKNEYKIPHMGWNSLSFKQENPLIEGLAENDFVYFVHSFKAETAEKYIIASAEYGEEIPAIVHDGGNVYGTQFHPEKSERVGLKILENFAHLGG